MTAISCSLSVLGTISSPLERGAERKLRPASPGRPLAMVAVSDFSGLTRCACAFASAAASAANDSLDRCTGGLRVEDIEAHRARFRALGPHAMPDGLLGILRHQRLELGLGALVVEERATGVAEERREFRPGIGPSNPSADFAWFF